MNINEKIIKLNSNFIGTRVFLHYFYTYRNSTSTHSNCGIFPVPAKYIKLMHSTSDWAKQFLEDFHDNNITVKYLVKGSTYIDATTEIHTKLNPVLKPGNFVYYIPFLRLYATDLSKYSGMLTSPRLLHNRVLKFKIQNDYTLLHVDYREDHEPINKIYNVTTTSKKENMFSFKIFLQAVAKKEMTSKYPFGEENIERRYFYFTYSDHLNDSTQTHLNQPSKDCPGQTLFDSELIFESETITKEQSEIILPLLKKYYLRNILPEEDIKRITADSVIKSTLFQNTKIESEMNEIDTVSRKLNSVSVFSIAVPTTFSATGTPVTDPKIPKDFYLVAVPIPITRETLQKFGVTPQAINPQFESHITNTAFKLLLANKNVSNIGTFGCRIWGEYPNVITSIHLLPSDIESLKLKVVKANPGADVTYDTCWNYAFKKLIATPVTEKLIIQTGLTTGIIEIREKLLGYVKEYLTSLLPKEDNSSIPVQNEHIVLNTPYFYDYFDNRTNLVIKTKIIFTRPVQFRPGVMHNALQEFLVTSGVNSVIENCFEDYRTNTKVKHPIRLLFAELTNIPAISRKAFGIGKFVEKGHDTVLDVFHEIYKTTGTIITFTEASTLAFPNVENSKISQFDIPKTSIHKPKNARDFVYIQHNADMPIQSIDALYRHFRTATVLPQWLKITDIPSGILNKQTEELQKKIPIKDERKKQKVINLQVDNFIFSNVFTQQTYMHGVYGNDKTVGEFLQENKINITGYKLAA